MQGSTKLNTIFGQHLYNVCLMYCRLKLQAKNELSQPALPYLTSISEKFYWLQASPAAWPSGSERSFYDSRDRKIDGSTATQASFLRPWIRCYRTIISALVESNEQQIKEVGSKTQAETRKQRQLLSESGFVLRVAPPSLFCDRRIEMNKSIKKQMT